jgi:hypothetical protein
MPTRKMKKFDHGGARPNSGPKPNPDGPKTKKICVSVDKLNWQSAMKRWKKKSSWLVDKLISTYVNDSSVSAALESAWRR